MDQALSMATDATAETLDTPISAESIAKSAKSNLKVPDGMASEHILIDGDGSDTADEPTAVGKKFELSNPARGLRTEFTFFNEGFLKVRQFKKRKLLKNYMLELRFLKQKPEVTQRFVSESFLAAKIMGGAAAFSWLLTRFTSLDVYTFPASIVFLTGAVVALLLGVYQSGEKIVYNTASGSIPVLMLLTNFGCFRRARTIISEIDRAIGQALAIDKVDEETYLRAEMQDHYRLRNEGVITPKACNKASSRILARFG